MEFFTFQNNATFLQKAVHLIKSVCGTKQDAQGHWKCYQDEAKYSKQECSICLDGNFNLKLIHLKASQTLAYPFIN